MLLAVVDGLHCPRNHSRKEPNTTEKQPVINTAHSLGNDREFVASQARVSVRENISKLSKSLPILTCFEIGLHKVSRIHRDRQPSAVSVDAARGRG